MTVGAIHGGISVCGREILWELGGLVVERARQRRTNRETFVLPKAEYYFGMSI